MPRLRTPSPALCVALLALFVALGGTTWAAMSLPPNSVGTRQLMKSAVNGQKVRDHSLTGADIALSTLGAVPSARSAAHATSADSAAHAASADLATHATAADVAGVAYSTHFETGINLPTALTPVASLNLPAGSYVLSAKGQIDTFHNDQIVECDLIAGSDVDRSFGQGGDNHQSQILGSSLVHSFATAGTVNLSCSAFNGATLSQVRVTAVTVGSISSAS
jgi:hypothetical protein